MNELSEGWVKDKLGNLVDISIGKTPKRSEPRYWQNGIHKWATIASMDFGKELTETAEHITDDALRETKPRKVPKDTLLFSFKLTIGKIAFAGCDLYTNEAIAAFIPKNGRIDKKFLFYALQVADLTINAGDAAKGTTLNTKTMPLIEVTFPENMNEQRRIVARIEKLTSRAEKARALAQERETELNTLLQATYSRMIEDVKWKPLKEVAFLIRRGVKTKPEAEYEEMGVRSFGKGTFKKPVLTGEQIGKKRIYWIHEGDLVFNNVFAWEKAIAVAQEEDHGRVGSHRFITYVPNEKQVTSEFMCHHFLSEKGIDDIRAASPGSAGRNRTLGLKKLEKILVPVPDYDEQLRFAEMAKRRLEIQKETAKVGTELKVYSAAVIAKAFRGEL
ncbi:MAG: restriction endonuclease subunit S [Deltaproteobacteria bacterium]|nr:restriction endonuclease subunit S [Deltaproteobacteria bacterium]MDL1986922.1 restriction endonuclease subunit S [Deltaproteobacteria bacterium]